MKERAFTGLVRASGFADVLHDGISFLVVSIPLSSHAAQLRMNI